MSDGGEYDLTPPEPKAVQPGKPKPGEPGFVPPKVIIETAESPAPEADADTPVDPDVAQHKGLAIAGYLLFLIPLLAAPNSKFARFHANQGLLVFILWWIAIICVVALQFGIFLVGAIIGDRIWILSTFFSCVFHLLQPALLVGAAAMAVIGILHAANGETKPLPGIGHFRLIK